MFWKRAKYILEWTVQTPRTPELDNVLRELGWRSRRAVLIGLVIGWGAYVVCGLILPNLELPWWRGSLIALGVATAFGLLFTAINKFDQKGSTKNYGLAETFVRLSDGKRVRFKACLAYFVHLTEARLELVPRHDYVIFIELPESAALREEIIAFVMARVPHWTHPEAPHELTTRAGQLQGFPLVAFWLGTLAGSLAVAASLGMGPLYIPLLLGPGVIWAWTVWQRLNAFSWHWRLRVAFTLSLAGNFIWVTLLTLFSGAFNIARIAP